MPSHGLKTAAQAAAVLATAVALAGCQPADTAPPTGDGATRHFGGIAFEPCSLAGAGQATAAFCATHEVPEDPAVRLDTTGRTIEDALGDVLAALDEAGYLHLKDRT